MVQEKQTSCGFINDIHTISTSFISIGPQFPNFYVRIMGSLAIINPLTPRMRLPVAIINPLTARMMSPVAIINPLTARIRSPTYRQEFKQILKGASWMECVSE